MELVTPALGLIFWTALSFFILLFILGKFAWKPILKAVGDREDSIKSALVQADDARREMENLKSDNEKILKEARAERDLMLKEATDLKNSIVSEAKDEAKSQANKMIEQARTAIQNEKVAAMTEMKSQMANLSIDIAEKVVKEQLSNKDKQVQMVETLLADVKLN